MVKISEICELINKGGFPFCSPGEVFDYLVAHGRMKEKEARAKFRQVSHHQPRSSVVIPSLFSEGGLHAP